MKLPQNPTVRKSQIGIDIQTPVSQTINQTDDEAPDNIDGERAPGEGGCDMLLYYFGHQIPCHSTQCASNRYIQNPEHIII